MRRTQTRNSVARQTRREQGDARNAAWRGLSFLEQVAILDSRLGKDKGAKRQRAKIAAGLAKLAKETK